MGMRIGALMRNASLRFICKDVHLRIERNDTVFTRCYGRNAPIRIPIAHHDGNYFASDDVLDRLEDEDRVAFRYCTAEGKISEAANPNGSLRHIAGIYNESLNVLWLMPQPERLASHHSLRSRLQQQAIRDICAHSPELAAYRLLDALFGEKP